MTTSRGYVLPAALSGTHSHARGGTVTFEEDWKLTPSGRHLARSLGLSGVDELLSVSLLAEEMLRDLPGLGDEDDVFEYLARVIEIGYLRWDGGGTATSCLSTARSAV